MKKFPHHCFEIPSPPPTTAMPSLKLSMSAASFSSKPYKWTLSFSPPSSSAALRPCSAPPPPPPPPSPYPSAAAPLVICSSAPIDSSSGRAWRRIPTCAHRALFNDYRYGYTVFRCSSSSRNNNKNKNKTSSLLLGLPSPFPGATTTTSDRRVSISSSPFSPSPSPSSHSHRRNCGSSFSPPKASGFSGSISSPSGGGGVIAEEEDMGSDGKVRDAVEWRRRRGGAVNGLDQPSSSPPSADDTNQNQYCSTKFLTLPTILTLGRVAAVPLLITTFYVDSWWGRTATTSIFIAAAVTDWLDGYLARKMKLGSAFGAFLDPVADKLMVAATLVILCTKPLEAPMIGPVPWLLTVPSIAIIGREITMSAVREWAASQDTKLLEAVAVNNLGKWKTATQMTALTILLAARDGGVGGPGGFVASGVVLLYISAGLSVYSLAVYMSKIWKVLLK